MTRIQLVKLVDSCVGAVAIRFAAHVSPRLQYKTSYSILLIRPGGIGDSVLLIPTIIAIKSHYPDAVIDVLAEHRNGAIFGLCPHIRTVYCYDKPLEFLSAMRGSYDVVIDSEQWHRLSAVVARMTRAPMLIGYATNERSRLFTHQIPYSQNNYELENFINLTAPLGIPSQIPPERFLEIPPAVCERTTNLLGVDNEKPFVAIFPGASIPERRWGADRFRSVAEMLLASGISVVVIGSEADRDQGELIVAGGVGLNLAGRTSLAETAAIIDRSALMVSGDSGVLHIAVGLGKPTVSLFGPGRARKWAPRGERHIVLNKELPCSPCTTFGTTPPCPINARCMQSITVDEVVNAVTTLIRGQ